MNLKFRDDGAFTIVQFTDLHYRNGEAEDLQSTRLMGDILDAEKPDLVALTGDVIDGSFCRDPLKSWANAVQPIVDRGMPWAAVFGNHDDEGAASRQQLMHAMRKLPGCLATPGPEHLSGVGNYTLTISSDGAPAVQFYFIDSHSYADAERRQYAWICQDQIAWFGGADHSLPALVFFHIPVPEYDDVWNAGNCAGSKNEPVCCPRFNSGFFAAMESAGNVRGLFVGHDHTNDYAGDLSGIRLCYGRATGFSSYGKEGFARGGRVIRLSESGKRFETSVVGDRTPKDLEPQMNTDGHR